MAFKKLTNDHSTAEAASVAVDLGMSDAKLGSILRALLGKLAGTQVVTVVPEKDSQPAVEAVKAAVRAGEISQQRAQRFINGLSPLGADVSSQLQIGNFEAKIRPLAEIDSSEALPLDDLDRAIAAAEERGKVAVAAMADTEEMLSTAEIAERIEISRQAVAKRRDYGQILALKAGPKSLRYPDWQILPTGQVVEGIQEILQRLDGDGWAAYRMLKEIAPDGSDRPLYELLRDGDTETVLAHIDGILGGAGT